MFRRLLTHSSNTHVQPSSGARCLIFGRTLRLLPDFMCLLPNFMCLNSEGFGESERMHRLVWAFTGRLCDKYHNLMSWLLLHYFWGPSYPNCYSESKTYRLYREMHLLWSFGPKSCSNETCYKEVKVYFAMHIIKCTLIGVKGIPDFLV